MRHTHALLASFAISLLAACADEPSAPVLKPQLDVATGQEFSFITGPIQTLSDYDAFVAATGATLRIDPNWIGGQWLYNWTWGNPYEMNGLKVDYYPYDRWNLGIAIGERTPLLPGREFTFNGDDNMVITTDGLVYALGIFVVDNTLVEPSGTYRGLDSRWSVVLYDLNDGEVGRFNVDPPANQKFFVGIKSDIPFHKAVFVESPADYYGENDFWGKIYATPPNVPPTVSLLGATLIQGERFASNVVIADDDGIRWSVAVDFGDDGNAAFTSMQKVAPVDHLYDLPGDYSIAVVVTDDRLGVGTTSALVHILSLEQGAAVLQETVNTIVSAGALSTQDAKPLLESINAALAAISSGNSTAALGKLGAFDNKVNALANSRRITAATQKQLLDFSARLQQRLHKK